MWASVMAGAALGSLAFSARVHIGERRLWRAPEAPLRVVIVGGSCGIGKALAREFLRCAGGGGLPLSWCGGAGPCPWAAVSHLPNSLLTAPPSRLPPAPARCRSCGDYVVVTSRSAAGAQQAVQQLREEVGPGASIAGEGRGRGLHSPAVLQCGRPAVSSESPAPCLLQAPPAT